jgi:hypothetical protein
MLTAGKHLVDFRSYSPCYQRGSGTPFNMTMHFVGGLERRRFSKNLPLWATYGGKAAVSDPQKWYDRPNSRLTINNQGMHEIN